MIRPLDPLDFVRCAFLSESEKSNRAYVLSNFGREKPFTFSLIEASKTSLLPRSKGCTWVWSQGNKVFGLVAATQRSGPKSWEVTQLFLRADGEAQLLGLLEKVSQAAASHGAERVFIRLLQNDPLIYVARRGGFFPRVPEVLYRGLPQQARNERQASPEFAPPSSLREKAQSDDYELFRLYNKATPSTVRSVVGMTFEQWRDSRELAHGPCQEFVLDKDGSAIGWMRAFRRSDTGHLETMAHPDEEQRLESVVDFGIEQLKETRVVYCLTPKHQVAFQRILMRKGFQAVSDYVTLVKSVAISAREKAHVRATMPST